MRLTWTGYVAEHGDSGAQCSATFRPVLAECSKIWPSYRDRPEIVEKITDVVGLVRTRGVSVCIHGADALPTYSLQDAKP
jgi:hypothetical protein